MHSKLYLQRRIIALEERVAMLETKQEILLEALDKIKKERETMNKDLLLKELDILETYFEEVIDGASEDGVELDTIFMLNNLKGYVEDAIKYVKGE